MNSLLRNDARVIHVFRKFVASMLALSLLLISTVPVVSAAARCNMPGMDTTDMDMTDMDMANMQMQVEPVSPLMDPQDCFIECGCRLDNHLDGMPHQLAPHTLSLTACDTDPGVTDAVNTVVPALLLRHLILPTPPPRIS